MKIWTIRVLRENRERGSKSYKKNGYRDLFWLEQSSKKIIKSISISFKINKIKLGKSEEPS